MDEASFDRARFVRALRTGRLGHALFTRREVESTNDAAWDLAQRGADEGACVVADVQTRGRGRMNRVWHSSPGKGLALSVLLHPGCDPTTLSTTPLVAGLALRRGLDALGVEAWLKWPNDLVVRGRKLSGILAESRRNAEGMDVIVLGVGVNVSQESQDFPPELRACATSIAIEGREARREAVAAAFLNALEPLWDEHVEGDPGKVLDAWRSEAGFWGRRIVARTPQGRVEGVAYGLDARGGLVVRTPAGETRTVVTADLEVEWPDGSGGGGTAA